MERTDLMDTKPWAHRMMVERFRAMTPEQRLQIAIDRTNLGRQIAFMAAERRRLNMQACDH